MTWNTLTNLSAGDTLTAGEMDKIRENIEHLGAMKFASVALSSLTAADAARVAMGSYTGNGTSQNITGVGFNPKFVIVQNTANAPYWKWTTHGSTNSYSPSAGGVSTTMITGLITDGFSVGSGANANSNTVTHYWIAFG